MAVSATASGSFVEISGGPIVRHLPFREGGPLIIVVHKATSNSP